MAEAVKAGTWPATSAVGIGEAVVVAACWLVGVLADDGDDGQHDERPGSVDPGLIDDEKWRQQLLKKMDGDMGLRRKCLASSEMDHDRSGIELNLLMTGEEDSPRVASMINVGLRSQQIWNVRIVFFVMNGSDGPSGRSPVVGIDEDDDGVVLFFVDGVQQ
ncbi:hypothetical protein ACLOJK_027387 [Asimina triloba]